MVVLALIVVISLAIGHLSQPPVRQTSPGQVGPTPDDLIARHAVAAADTLSLRVATEGIRAALSTRAAGRHREAADALLSLADFPGFADWGMVLAAESRGETGDRAAVMGLLELIPRDLAEQRGWRALVAVAEATGDPALSAETALAALPRLTSAADSASALAAVGRALLAAKDPTRAKEQLVRAIQSDPRSRGAMSAAEVLRRSGRLGPGERAALAVQHLAQGQIASAIKEMEQVAWRGEGESARADLEVRLIETLLARQRTEEARARALAGAGSATDPLSRARLHVLAGRAHLRMGAEPQAIAALERAVQLDPAGIAGQQASYLLGDLDQDNGDRERARSRFAEATTIDGSTEWGAESAVRLGILLFEDGRYREALGVFDRYRHAARETWRIQQAAYWAGRSAEAMGDLEATATRLTEARSLNPLGYYGWRAHSRLGTTGSEIPDGPPVAARADSAAVGLVGRIAALESLNLPEAARMERARAVRAMNTLSGGLHALAEAYHRAERHQDGMAVAREASRLTGSWDARLLRSAYPVPYACPVEQGAAAAGVDPALVAALIREESRFQARAVSPAGAVGLMQLVPGTARSLAARAGLRSYQPSDLRDPSVNIQLGTRHLRDLLERRGGRVHEVLAAYNAGGTRLARWRTLTDATDPDLLLERIPYRETREYVRLVQENAAIYGALYWATPPGQRASAACAEPAP